VSYLLGSKGFAPAGANSLWSYLPSHAVLCAHTDSLAQVVFVMVSLDDIKNAVLYFNNHNVFTLMDAQQKEAAQFIQQMNADGVMAAA